MSRPPALRTEIDRQLFAIGAPVLPSRGDVLAARYVIEGELGGGGTGTVFRAYDSATKSDVALKLFRREGAGRQSGLDRLGREVRHAREVQHPNVCRVFELHESEGFTFFTMELARTSLRGAVERAARRPLTERMADARAVAAGLSAIHEAGIVHRDLKPENLLRRADGSLVVSDFGVAGYQSGPRQARAGTQGYLAPEVRKGRPATARSDLWSLGVVLHELLFGRRPEPFAKGTPHEAALAELCRACTALSPSRRPASAAAVLARLEELDGETLRDRLRRCRLPLADTLSIATQLLDALAAVHRRGGVHGAVMPANVFSRRCDGAVRLLDPKDPLATTPVPPAYLAPEQARQERKVDGRADVFAVGCILVECLRGKPPDGERAPATALARRALGEGLDRAIGGVDATLRPLLHRMLARGRLQRPHDAGALARELSELSDVIRRRGHRPQPASALAAEQRLGAVIAVKAGAGRSIPAPVLATAESFGAVTRRLSASSFIAAIQDSGTPADLTSRAARCALAVKAAAPAVRSSIGTGRLQAELENGPRGTAIDRALRLLERAAPGDIRLDETAAALLSSGFQVLEGKPPRLLGEGSAVDRPRTVLGKEIPCVGRDRELGTLMGLWEECIAEPVARTVLVTAPAGAGKSRVRHELLDRIQSRGATFELLIGRGDALRAGAPFAMLAPALRVAAGLVGGEGPAIAQKRLLAHVGRHVAADKAKRVAAFIGEIADVPFPDDDLPALRSARQDPRLMSDQTLVAWLDYLEAECQAHPVLLVLEDLHWGDAPSVQFIDAALRALREKPLMVLAFARPEVDEKFANLWIERDPQRISLPPLTPRSAQKLVKAALPEMTVDQATWIVERADGNPFYLEELIRAVAGGAGKQALPETVIGMVQARFDALGADAKRVLRAAAVFGQTFRPAGVRHLLGGDRDCSLDQWLDILVQKEVLFSRQAADERELVFRHALVQEAAYDMLTGEDRVLGHRLAGQYFEAAGEREAILLVEHYERGGASTKAAYWCRFAAEQALDANDLREAVARAERGVRLGAAGEVLASTRLAEARARSWLGDQAGAEGAVRVALRSSLERTRAAATVLHVYVLGARGAFDEIKQILARLLELKPSPRGVNHWCQALLRGGSWLVTAGDLRFVELILAKVSRAQGALDDVSLGYLFSTRYYVARSRGQLVEALEWVRAAVNAFDRAEDLRSACGYGIDHCGSLGELGLLTEAEAGFRAGLRTAERLSLNEISVFYRFNLGYTLALQGRPREAKEFYDRAVSDSGACGDRCVGASALFAGLAAECAGDTHSVEGRATTAVRACESQPTLYPMALALLARHLLSQNRVKEALALSRKANHLLESGTTTEEGDAGVRLALIRSLFASGDNRAAVKLIQRAHRDLERRTAQIQRPDLARSYRRYLPEHREIDRLARKHLGRALVDTKVVT